MTQLINAIADPLGVALQAIYGLTGSYVAALILLTAGIKAILHPLTRKQLSSMKAMAALAPQMEVLRRKHKDDPRQLNAEVMNLYRANRVNPFGGCLPLLLQLPILWALFTLLRRPNVFGTETLFGIPLSASPQFGVVLTHPLIVLIPLLVGLTTYWQQRMSITDPSQARMFIFMPFFVAYTSIAGWFPLGLSIYWIISTALYIVEYYIVVGPPKKPAIAPPRDERARARRQAKEEGKPRPSRRASESGDSR